MKRSGMFVTLLLFTGTAVALGADNAATKHAAVKTSETFFAAVAAGKVDEAEKLLVSGTYSEAELRKLNEILRWDEAKVREAYVGKEQSAVLTDVIPPREEAPARPGARPRKGRWGVSLKLVDSKWLIRDLEFLPNDEKLRKFQEEFRKIEPNAEKVSVGE